jgi:hypothetical protein
MPLLPPASRKTQIVVTSSAQLTGTLRSDVVYLIDGHIDMGALSVEVPPGGLSIYGFGYEVASIYSDLDNATLFTSPAGSYSGNCILTGMTLYVTGVGSKVFALDNDGNSSAVELDTVNLGRFGAPGSETTSLGSLTAYRQFRMAGCAIIRVQDGLEFVGTWAGGAAIDSTILLSIAAGVTIFKAGAGLDFQGSTLSNINALSVDNTATVFDWADANFSRDEGFALAAARFNIAAAHTPIPNMTEGSTKRFFRDCSGVLNTYPGGWWEITTETATTLTVNTPTKLLGTTTYNEMVYVSGAASNAFVFNSTIRKQFTLVGNVVISGGANDQIELSVRVWDDSAASYVVKRTFTHQISNLVGLLDVTYFTFDAQVGELSTNDRVELWVENTTDDTSVTALNGSVVTLQAR